MLLAACGGGGDSQSSTNNKISSVKVAGASLSDSGTFGYKFTVQSTTGTAYQVYSERVAAGYGMSSLCSAYTYTGSAFSPVAGCTNYAVAGAKVNNYNTTAGAVLETIPVSIIKQLADIGNAGYTANDLLIVGEASSNDAAALATAFLDDQFSGGATTEFVTLLSTLITPASADPAVLGTLYMRALADKLMSAVETNALAKGAPRVAVVNTLDITKTPRFQAVLALVSTASGAAAAAQIQALVQAWVQAYNTELATRAAASANASKIVVIDLFARFEAELTPPLPYGLTNVTATICDLIVTGGTAPGTTGLDTPAVVHQCTDTAAAALNLNGTGTGWQKYLFADSFHPTPYGHELLALVFFQSLTAVGWN
jgi:phospholipase/lecithinase/hemolysin